MEQEKIKDGQRIGQNLNKKIDLFLFNLNFYIIIIIIIFIKIIFKN